MRYVGCALAAIMATSAGAQQPQISGPKFVVGQTPPVQVGVPAGAIPAASPVGSELLFWRYGPPPDEQVAPPLPGARLSQTPQTNSTPAAAPMRFVAAPQPTAVASVSQTKPSAAAAPAPKKPKPKPRETAPFDDPKQNPGGGQSWSEFDVTDYTSRFSPADAPEEGVRQWLLQETGPVWNGLDLACLSVTAERVKVYHNAEVQQKVAAVLGRFLHFSPGLFRCRVRILSARDGSWRTAFAAKLEPGASGEAGRQAWRVPAALIEPLVQTLTTGMGNTLLADQPFEAPNGQRTLLEITEPKNYVRQIVRTADENRPQLGVVAEGLELKLRPLIADGASIDVAFEATVRKLLDQQAVPLDVPGEPNVVDVPEVYSASFTGLQRLAPGQHLLFSLGRGANLDPRPGLLKPRRPETLVLVEIAPAGTNTIAGSPVATPPALLAPVGSRPSVKQRATPVSKRGRESQNYSDLSQTPF